MTQSSSSSSSRPYDSSRVAPTGGRGLVRWAGLALALIVLNLALTFHNVWPTPWVTTHFELSVELGILLLVLVALSLVRGPPAGPLLVGLGLLYLAFTLGRYIEVTVPALFGRPLNLYWDARHLPAVAAMLVEAGALWAVAGVAVGVLLLLIGVYLLLRWALGQIGRGLGDPAQRFVLLAVGVALVGIYLAGRLSPALQTERWFSLPVSKTYAQQLGFLVEALGPRGGAQSLPPGPDWPRGLERLGGADLMLVFVESYGAVSFDRAEYAATLEPARSELARVAGESGLEVVSAFVDSPTFGGASWLAHASLLAGIEVRDHADYDLLLTTDRPTLVRHLRGAGYRAVALMPGLRRAWPEGAFYGFDRIYDSDAIDYRGPDFGWWAVPDQYALARLHALELDEAERAPVLVFFPTISSHAPFRPVPPYESDWTRLLAGDAYATERVDPALSVGPDWSDLGSGYVDALEYVYTYLAGFLADPAPRDLIMVILGDHQPPASVTGKDAGWEVPVHVITSRPRLRDELIEAGFVRGMRPRRPAVARMHELGLLLLAAGRSASPDFVQSGVDIAGGGLARQGP